MATYTVGQAVDVERRGTDEVACVEGAAVSVLGVGMDFDEGLDVGEARLAWIAAFGDDPVDLLGGSLGARLNTAMALLDSGFGDELIGGSRPEVAFDIGLEAWLVAF